MALLTAFLIDRFVGEPPARLHPVSWMGAALHWLRDRAPSGGKAAPFFYGAISILAGCTSTIAIGVLLQRVLARMPWPLGILTEAVLLNTLFAQRGLLEAGGAVGRPLARGDLETARQQLAWHLVSRETRDLSASQVAGATIESLAENSSDSIVAPLFYYALAGLPGALTYRWLNTADAMWGYRDEAREWLGKCAARLDDGANWLPARITAGLIVVAGLLGTGDPDNALRIWQRDAQQTSSPNAGQPMSAMAGSLHIELQKVGHYSLGTGLSAPQAKDIERAIRVVKSVGWLALLIFSLVRCRVEARTAENAD